MFLCFCSSFCSPCLGGDGDTVSPIPLSHLVVLLETGVDNRSTAHSSTFLARGCSSLTRFGRNAMAPVRQWQTLVCITAPNLQHPHVSCLMRLQPRLSPPLTSPNDYSFAPPVQRARVPFVAKQTTTRSTVYLSANGASKKSSSAQTTHPAA